MKNFKALALLLLVTYSNIGCFEDNDDIPITTAEINDFVWKGMNLYYLYKEDVPNLANNRFSTSNDYLDYLDGFQNPKSLFEDLIYNRENVDRFSWIVDDYIALEQFLSGTTSNNGMEYQLFKFSETDTNRYGVVTHVLPNTDAESKGIKRGDIFYGIDGIPLTSSNSSQLLRQNSYTINLGAYDDNSTPETNDDSVNQTSESISLSKSTYTENPILIHSILDLSNTKIGYLMYNGFTGTDQFNSELNAVFGTFKSGNINELVLDLRYNPGGSVYTATLLSSLITGQFAGAIFNTEQWNPEFQEALQDQNPEQLINRFLNNDNDASLNNLNLTKVYVLTTKSSASASELVINSLRPYIDVVQIGTATAGKYQASITVYDSPNFRRQGVNQRHAYAMQPLIYKSLNINGVTDYFNGLDPDIVLGEQFNNLGILGNVNEPLLAAAISRIMGTGRFPKLKSSFLKVTHGSEDFEPFEVGMYTEKEIPLDLLNRFLVE
ncbi:S41 family peptidase [Flaviramulus aquimarinus]